MPVIINEVEVVPEPQNPPQPPDATTTQQPVYSPVRLIVRTMKQQQSRRLRVRAY